MEILGYQLSYTHALGMLAVLLIGYYVSKLMRSSQKKVESEMPVEEPDFSTSKQVTMYGKDTCPWCVKQKNELGDLFDNVKYVDCQKEKCDSVTALPTWEFDGERHEGFLTKADFLNKCK